MFIGDSWTYVIGANTPKNGFASIAAGKLGVVPDISGYGAVGYVAKGADRFGAYQARLAYDKPTADPALIVLRGS